MKKMLTVMAMVIALVMSTMAMAGATEAEEGADLVTVCHVNAANGVVLGGAGNEIYLGRLIEIDASALDAFLAIGSSDVDELGDLGGLITPDTTTVSTRDPGWQWDSIMTEAAAQDVDVVNANCAFRLAS